MSTMADQLAQLLSSVRRPGDFYAAGTIELHAPRLTVDGVGPVALPLLPMQAAQLVAAAEQAPYGRGADTLIDTQVRRTWQIGADRVRIEGKHWTRTLDGIVSRVADGLGVAEPIAAELYKLLIYDQGSFFVSHRDSEKVAGMFATLVVVLPSISTGGELVVRHKGREARLDLRCEDPSEAAFAAFYADCVHEVLPVTSGCRLALVYNLLRRAKGPMPEPPSYDDEQARVASLFQAWSSSTIDDDAPAKLIYPLEHAYTAAELGFDTLKGADAAITGVLAAASAQSDCDLHLALVKIEESGAAEYCDRPRSRGRWSDADDFEAGEVFDRNVSLSEWRRPDGSRPPLGDLPIEDEELSPPDVLEAMEPDEEEFHEASGNEGVSFDRTYSRAALVLWPRERFLAVLNQAGPSVTLPFLADLTERWAAGGEDRQSLLWRQAHELSGHMISGWPKEGYYQESDEPRDAARLLMLSTQLEDTARLAAFLAHMAEHGICANGDVDAILGALGLFSVKENAAFMERLVAGTAKTSLGTCARLLCRVATATAGAGCAHLSGAAAVLLDALPGDAAPREIWQHDSRVQPSFIVDLFTALTRIDAALAERAADHVLAWPQTYELDRVLVPALRELMGQAEIKDSSGVDRLRRACVEHLRSRVVEPLEAPTDWKRASAVGCSCRYCSELSIFLAAPEQKTWTLRAAEAHRRHVQATIKSSRCDVNVRTERRGSPHSLICTKNQASYERRVEQRSNDVADLDRLEP